MNFFKKLFGKSTKESNTGPETDGKTYLKTDKGTYILNKSEQSGSTYTELSSEELMAIKENVTFFKDSFGLMQMFDKDPINHPVNLDMHLTRWAKFGYEEFLGASPKQHAALLAYNFGQYLVDNYGMQWKKKSTENGSQTVVRMEKPVEIELYPIDSTLRAIQNKQLDVYAGIEEKLQKALLRFSK